MMTLLLATALAGRITPASATSLAQTWRIDLGAVAAGVHFSASGATVGVGSEDGAVTLWSVDERRELGRLERAGFRPRAFELVGDDELIVAWNDFRETWWHVEHGVLAEAPLDPGFDRYAPGGRFSLHGGMEGVALLPTVAAPAESRAWWVAVPGARHGLELHWLDQRRMYVTIYVPGRRYLNERLEVRSREGGETVTFPEGSRFVHSWRGDDLAVVSRWDSGTESGYSAAVHADGRTAWEFRDQGWFGFWSPGGDLRVTVNYFGDLEVWDLATNSVLRHQRPVPPESGWREVEWDSRMAHFGPRFAVSPRRNLLAVVAHNTHVVFWEPTR